MSYTHLTMEKRLKLYLYVNQGMNLTEISREIGVHRTTVSRELVRGKKDGEYQPYYSQKMSSKRSRNRSRPVLESDRLMQEVRRRLLEDHSPEQISGRLPIDFPDDPTMRISHESIYVWVYRRIRNGEKNLRDHLRHGRVRRRKRLHCKEKRLMIHGKVFIDDRPDSVGAKLEAGHWEGDTITGSRHKGYVATFVERVHKYLVAFPIQEKKSAYFTTKIKAAFKKIPAELKKTLTVDNGPEFACHKQMAYWTGMNVYFAHPYHSWERGLNEHTNGLIRQYLPKRIHLLSLEQRDLDRIIQRLNNRPRKSLGYRTPAESFAAATRALQN